MDINLGLSAVATGVDTITATYSPAPTLVDKKILFLRTAGTNTVTAPTFNPNGLGAQTITKNNGDALAVGDLDGDVILMYDSANTNWELLTPKVVGSSQTLAQVLATDNKTGAQNIVSDNGKSVVSVLDAVLNIEHTDAPFAGGFSVDPSIIQMNWNDGTAFSDVRADAVSMRLRHSNAIYNFYGLTTDKLARIDSNGNLVASAYDETDFQLALGYTPAPTDSPTFTTQITGSFLTASEMIGTDASSNIVSLPVATYPSLTELSYVKGLSSSVQTQLNNKVDTFEIYMMSGQISPADSTTYYFSDGLTAPSTTAGNFDFNMGFAFTITGGVVGCTNTITGSTELATLQLRNTTANTSTSIGTFETTGSPTVAKYTTFTGLSISVGASDLIEMRYDAPAYATNPTAVRFFVRLICQRA